ncbi:MAG: LacI family transcriptional regulator [Planctomycetes bacterium]|nr:LacI family transcriptional regulator [Planctomycetota bacterium]
MNEIAKRLNISIATVSRALSGKADTVSEETRKAIFEAVEKYGYRSVTNPAALCRTSDYPQKSVT